MEMNSVLIDIAVNVISSMVMRFLEWLFKRVVAPVAVGWFKTLTTRKALQRNSKEDASSSQ